MYSTATLYDFIGWFIITLLILCTLALVIALRDLREWRRMNKADNRVFHIYRLYGGHRIATLAIVGERDAQFTLEQLRTANPHYEYEMSEHV